MKKYQILLLLLAVIFVTGCKKKETPSQVAVTPAAQKNSLQSEHILGAVQETMDTKFVVRLLPDGRDTLILHSVKKQTYNRGGMLTGMVILTADGDTTQRLVSTYDQQGKLVRSDVYGKDGSLSSYVIYTNDAKGFRTKEEHFVHDTLSYAETYTNDPNGNVLVTQISNGSETYYIRYTNDENGLPLKAEWFNEGISRAAYQTQQLEYDKLGNVINRQVTIQNRNVEYYHAQFNEKGQLLKDIYQGSMPNQLVEVVSKYGVHDSHGNWTHQEVYQNQQKYYLVERTIKYY